MNNNLTKKIAALTALLFFAGAGAGTFAQEMPENHPPINQEETTEPSGEAAEGELPEGHPPINQEGATESGEEAAEGELPEGHPPINQQAATEVDEDSEEILRSVQEYFQEYPAIKYTVDFKTKYTMGQETMEESQKVEVLAEAPNKYFRSMSFRSNMSEQKVSDGEKLYVAHKLSPEINFYEESEAPDSLEGILDGDPLGHALMNDLVLLEDGYSKFVKDFSTITYEGKETEGEKEFHKLNVTSPRSSGELVIQAGEKPLPKKLTYEMRQGQVNVDLEFSGWTTAQDLPDENFAFTAPEGAEKVDSVRNAIRDEMQKQMDQQRSGASGGGGNEPLVGEKAPDFTLENMEGKEVSLSDHKGQDIVILDFWASWCGPCRKALPIVNKVANDYEEKGVALYAVNLRESKEKAQGFLDEEDISPAVLFDKTGDVGEKFKVSGIPHTVIIDKEGTVQAVHVGFLPGLEDTFRSELDTLLDGKDLAQE